MNVEAVVSCMLEPVLAGGSERHSILFFFGDAGPHGHRPELDAVAERILELVSGFVARTSNTPNFMRRGAPADAGSGAFTGTPELIEIMKHSTLVVAIENALSAFATRDGAALAGKRVIHLGETVPPRAGAASADHVPGDALGSLLQLERELARRLAEAGPERPVFPMHPRAVVRVLNEELPRSAMLFIDICAAGMAYAGQLRLSAGQCLELDVEQNGCMGQAFGESIGARLGAPKEVGIACLIGDGTFKMAPTGSLHSLAISGRGGGYALTVLENGGFDFVRQGVENGGIAVDGLEHAGTLESLANAERHVEGKAIGVHTHDQKPDFVAGGALWRCEARLCSSLAEYRRNLRNAFSASRPVILEVPINPVFRAPIGDRSASIAKLFGNGASGNRRRA
jgi:thiamine pyrophosphate-dependent acetolactate synthase large subunit-like protein